MGHEKMEEVVSAFMDGQIDVEAETLLFAHLGSCAECREFFKGSLTLQKDIGQTRPSVSPSLKPAQLSPLRLQIWRKSVPFPIAALIAMVALVSTIALGTLWLRPNDESAKSKQEVVYIQRLPAIQVVGFYPPNAQVKK